MLHHKYLAALTLPFVFFLSAFSQTEKIDPNAKSKELRAQALEFLRETATDVASLRTLENRISFSSEMAGLMWFENEKEGRTMYQTAISDFKQLLTQYDAQMIALNITPDKDSYRGGFLAGLEDESEKSRLSLKFNKAMAVRRQIALSLAEHAPDLAFGFFSDTLLMVTNVEFRKQLAEQDKYFEQQLIKEVAKNDPAKAFEYGRKSMDAGVTYSHLDLLGMIYEKDQAKGGEFAAEILKKLKENKSATQDLWIVSSALNRGAANFDEAKKNGKKPMFAEADLRDLAELTAQTILARSESEDADFGRHLPLVERFAPARAVQIRAKFPPKQETKKSSEPDALQTAIEEAGKETAKVNAANEEAVKNLEKIASKELPLEEREKIVNQSRQIITELPTRQAKIMALSGLAAQVAKMGDRELAAEIMRDAQNLVRPDPKNYRDYLEAWLLINGLAEVDPEKAFPVLEQTIYRLNGTLEAFVKVAEFIDVAGEIVDDGEVQVGAFGGSMIREVTGNLGMADGVIRNLSAADFGKMRTVANGFDRTEIRVLAKMLVLRAILGDRTKKSSDKLPLGVEELTQ